MESLCTFYHKYNKIMMVQYTHGLRCELLHSVLQRV